MTTDRNRISPVAVIGYGSQGRALALNLHDSGVEVLVGLRDTSTRRQVVRDDGLTAEAVDRVVAQAQTIVLAIPDHVQESVWREAIAPHVSAGMLIVALHGTAIHFGMIVPPTECDTVMLAPHGPGVMVREAYQRGDQSISAFWAIRHDATGTAGDRLWQFASACGFDRRRCIESTFAREAVGDLFGEQAVLCGGLTALIKHGFDTLVSRGLPADDAYLEVCYQLDLIIALIKKHGIAGMYERISIAAQYGALTHGSTVIGPEVRLRMEKLYDRIADGRFANELRSLDERAVQELSELRQRVTSADFEQAARRFANTDKSS